MATSISHTDIKPILGIATLTTSYDDELDIVCTAVGLAVDEAVGAVFLAANPDLLEEAAICIAAGKCWLGMCNRPGYAEAVNIAGLAVGPLDKAGAVDLIKTGWNMLKIGMDGAKVENATDLPQESHGSIADASFPIDSPEYSNGPGS